MLRGIVRRGGRVVVVDPRRSETARAFEHISISPDGDAWLLLSLLHVLFGEELEDRGALDRLATGGGLLSEATARFPPEATEARTGIPAAALRALMRDLAAADGAAVYGRTGSCLQYAEPVVPPAGEARQEWQIIEHLARPLGIIPSSMRAVRRLGKLGLRFRPEASINLLLRAGPDGDWFGLRRGGLSISRLRRLPHGVVLKEQIPTGVLSRRVRHRDRTAITTAAIPCD